MSYILSGKKLKKPFFCATQIMLKSLSAGYIALGETETGRHTTHITLFTWYDPFHNEVTHKCEQKKKSRVTDSNQMEFSIWNPIQALF